MLRLAFFRHAEGVGASLRDINSLQAELMAKLLPIRPSIVYSSPYDKAVETARVIAKVKKSSYATLSELAPAIASFEAIARYVRDGAVFVGHSPSIEAIVTALIGGGNIKLSPGGFALVEAARYAYGEGALVFLANPEFAMLG
ncbi:MAG: hypothetical protein QXS85_04060 [Acidilobaceae archaeon]